MSVVNGDKIKAPVTMADVNLLLGTSHTDMSTLIKDTHVNKWGKYKPIRATHKEPVTYHERYLAGYGLNIPRLGTQENTFRSLAIKLMQYRDGTLGKDIPHWEYLKPRGTNQNEFYRLTDFCRHPQEMSQSSRFDNGDPTNANVKGYYRDAQNPVDIYMLDRAGVEYQGTYNYEVNLQATGILVIYANQPNYMSGLHLFDLVSGFNSGTFNPANPHYRIVVEKWRNQTLIGRYFSDPILDNYSNYYIEVDISDGTANTSIELVVGIQKTAVVNNVINVLEGPDNFIPPFDDEEWQDKRYPFYYALMLRSYAVIKMEIKRDAQNVGYGINGLLTWNAYAWMTTSTITGDTLWVKAHLNKLTAGVNYQFVDANTEPDAGKVGVRYGIQEREKLILDSNGQPTNLITASPSNSSRQTSTKVNIETTTQGDDIYSDIYFLAAVLDSVSDSRYYINNGNVHNFQIYVKTKTGANWSGWSEAEWLGIKKGTV